MLCRASWHSFLLNPKKIANALWSVYLHGAFVYLYGNCSQGTRVPRDQPGLRITLSSAGAGLFPASVETFGCAKFFLMNVFLVSVDQVLFLYAQQEIFSKEIDMEHLFCLLEV